MAAPSPRRGAAERAPLRLVDPTPAESPVAAFERFFQRVEAVLAWAESQCDAETARATESEPLLDRRGLARLLGISLPSLDAMRREPGFPELRAGDAPRFERAAVLAWLRERGAR